MIFRVVIAVASASPWAIIEHNLFFLKLFGHPGIPRPKSQDIQPKFCFPWVSKEIRMFETHPIQVKVTYPTGRYPDPKVWVRAASFLVPQIRVTSRAPQGKRVNKQCHHCRDSCHGIFMTSL